MDDHSDILNEKLKELRAKNDKKLSNVASLMNSYELVASLVQSQLGNIKKELVELNSIGGGLKNKLENAIKSVDQTVHSTIITERREILLEQVIVLNVGVLESYMNDIVRVVGNYSPEKFHFHEGENITFSSEMLKYGFSLGDAILQNIKKGKGKERGENFQDIQSIIRSFRDNLKIDFDEDYDYDDLILTTALRHIITHNSSQVDIGFINQISDTKYVDNYIKGKYLAIDEGFIEKSQDAIKNLANVIISDLSH